MRRQQMTFQTHLVVPPDVRVGTTRLPNGATIVRVEIIDGLTLAASDASYMDTVAEAFTQAASFAEEPTMYATSCLHVNQSRWWSFAEGPQR